MPHFADCLTQRILETNSRLCVGIDPRLDRLPLAVTRAVRRELDDPLEAAAESVKRFSLKIVEAVADKVAVVKPQAAYFECLGWRGMKVLAEVVQAARAAGLLVITDCKRGDIGATSEAYAIGHLGGLDAFGTQLAPYETDAVTVNPYMGSDAVDPFVQRAKVGGKGVFVLVRTSNPSGAELQDLLVDGLPVWQHVAELTAGWAEGTQGQSGYSLVGAVVGATCPEELARLREMLPGVPFLVPGFGAQGGTAADVAAAFDAKGTGAVVNSSRGVIFPKGSREMDNWIDAVVTSAELSTKSINEALSL